MYKDLVTYNIGDIVQSKVKAEPQPRTIQRTALIGEEQYQVLYFEDDPNSANVANDYHPFKLEARRHYYEFMKSVSSFKNMKGKSKEKAPNKERDKDDDLFENATRKETLFNYKLPFLDKL
jgi:hypothetical protein